MTSTKTWLIAFGAGNDQNADAIIRQGLDDITTLSSIEPEDIDIICTSARKPGGTVTNGGRQPGIIPNPGQAIPALFQQRLKLAVTAAHHYDAVGRLVEPSIMTWPRVQHFRNLTVINENWRNPEPLPSLSKMTSITKMIELISQQLRKVLGVRKIPLFYVIRKDAVPPPITNAPFHAAPSTLPYGAQFGSFHDELIARASHNHPSFAEDNALVLNVLMQSLQTTSHMGTLKSFERTRDGRGAFKALEAFNNGKSKWDSIVANAERVMFTQKFDDSNNRYTLFRHIANHRDAYNDMVSANDAETYEYQVPNEHTRVQRFLHSLTTTDQRIVSGKSFIIGNHTLLNNFAAATEYLLQVAPPIKTPKQIDTHKIAGVLQKGKGFHKEKLGKTGVELRYYTRREYNKLKPAQKKEVTQWRKQNKRRESEEQDKKRGNPQTEATTNKKFKTLESTIAALQSELASLKAPRSATITEDPHTSDALNPPSRPIQSILRN